MGRSIQAGHAVHDQIDFYESSSSFIRVPGITLDKLAFFVFYNNSLLSWSAADGSYTPDANLTSGYVLFNEISGSPGFYSIRFFPDRVGYWRIIVYNTLTNAQQIRDYDISPAQNQYVNSTGLNASFIK